MIFSSLGVSPPQPGTSAPPAPGLSQSGSPSAGGLTNLPNPHIYRVLNEAVSLDDAEVYSWFPEPEYDPHYDAEDGEVTDDGLDDDSSYESEQAIGDIDMEPETPASWGAGGMDLDDVPESPAPSSIAAMPPPEDVEQITKRKKRNPDLLWSQNYFFYSK